MKFLVVGYGAREYAMAKRLKDEGHQVDCFLTKRNAPLARLARNYFLGQGNDVAGMVGFAKKVKTDCIVAGSEQPLFEGLVDLAQREGISAYGPTKAAARLEWDKQFAKDHVAQLFPELIGRYEVFSSLDAALRCLGGLEGASVVKSGDVDGGKGIVILKNPSRLSDSELRTTLSHMTTGRASIIVEELFEGSEFSIYCFSDGKNYYFTRAIKDYPFRLNGDKGKKTGGMGAVMDAVDNLPSITLTDYKSACDYVSAILQHVSEMAGIVVPGIISAQFFKTKDGIRFNEFDVRAGDPEMINVLETTESKFSDIIEGTCSGNLEQPKFKHEAVVAVYAVPRYYPDGRVIETAIRLDRKKIEDSGCRLYYGNVDLRARTLMTDSSRSLVISGRGRDIEEARRRVLAAATGMTRELDYRKDIGLFDEDEKDRRPRVIKNPMLETAIMPLPELSRKHGAKVYAKLETSNPTGTHKDRESRAVIADAIENGFERIGMASTGNAGISLAYYGLISGLECTIFVGKRIDPDKLKLLKALKARIMTAEDYEAALHESAVYFSDNEIYNANPGTNPVRSRGGETIGKEISERLRPDFVVVPLNNGTLIAGLWDGFRNAGQTPKFIGAYIEKSEIASSIAGLHLMERDRMNQLEMSGDLTKVPLTDPDIIEALKELAAENVFVEPSSAVVVAALNKVDTSDKTVCCVMTGSGIRFPHQFQLLSR
ncbi:pyridoxal-phosphate dependent enzyme [Candidatus Micrarchaeota archaeon]|nr:pyridoxal-phosphate dependent enzyme [Candidatus Micrarchaeota archaeon]MBU1165506.1 pyridoxal-phosphate dependent enzyme [Candidatus Micrarchaeota archaeon]MBU1886344.1 pyridoxal-phosphate dependent enzyme [Candidatus Micrarchaeota archaeon]